MIFTVFSVFNILIATAMIILILMQRGAGSDAGAGFGGGASGTVFGARGSTSFLTRTTGVLAGLFFLLSLGMGMYVSSEESAAPDQSLGVMASMAPEPATTTTAAAAVQPAPQPVDQVTPKPAAVTTVPTATTPAPSVSNDSVTPEPTTAAPTSEESPPQPKAND